jgi:hypothetical protein
MINLDKLNRWLTLGANIGVTAGIFFLALHVSQNTEALKAQSSFNQYLARTTSFRSLAENPDGMADILVKVQQGKPLSPVEARRLQFSAITVMDGLHWQMMEIVAGRQDMPAQLDKEWAQLFGNVPFLLTSYNERKSFQEREFSDFIDNEVIPAVTRTPVVIMEAPATAIPE